jgi:OOP family OmpA-OmpF porin
MGWPTILFNYSTDIMKLKLIIATGAALGLFTTLAHADGGYAGLSVGSAEQKKNVAFSSTNIDRTKDSTTAFKLLAGYQYNPTFGVEAGWVHHGSSDVALSGRIATLKPESFFAAGTATVPLGNQFSLFGKLGLAHHRTDIDGSHQTNNRGFAGLGLSYAFTQMVSGVVEYEDFGEVLDGPISAKSRVVSAGVRVAF